MQGTVHALQHIRGGGDGVPFVALQGMNLLGLGQAPGTMFPSTCPAFVALHLLLYVLPLAHTGW